MVIWTHPGEGRVGYHSAMTRLAWVGLLGMLPSCGGGGGGAGNPDDGPLPDGPPVDTSIAAPLCNPKNHVPETPMLLAPVESRFAIEPAALVLQSSAFSDHDGDVHAASEYEIWRVEDDVPVERVWRGTTLSGTALTLATLDQGWWEGSTVADGALAPWTWHVARTRHHDGESRECGLSAWSPDVTFRTEDGSSYLFDQTVVREFQLTIPPQSWTPVHDEAIPPGCVPWQRQFYSGDLEFEGQILPGVGVRTKGGCGSARNLDGKAGFRISLGWDDPAVPGCPDEREIHGQRHLTFNNVVQDPSFAHERLAYRLYEAAGVPVPRVAHVRLSVNGEYWGVYLLVETAKRRFLERRFESKNGMLYEGTYWCDLVPANVPPGEEDTYCLTREFSPDACDGAPEPDEDPQDYDALRDMVGTVAAMPWDSFYPEIESLWNYDAFLSAWAVEGITGHWDNYAFQIMNNYRVYHDPSTDLWSLLPHGLDQTFWDDRDPWNVSGVLAARCLGEPDCQEAMVARLGEVNEIFENLGLGSDLAAIHELIAPHVYEDPRKEISNDDFDNQYPGLAAWIGWRPWRIREIMAYHGF